MLKTLENEEDEKFRGLGQNPSNQTAIPSIVASINQTSVTQVFGFAETLQKVRFLFFVYYPLCSAFLPVI